MGVIFTLDSSIKSVTAQAITDLINELGKNCRLIYPPKKIPCLCGADPVGFKPFFYGQHGGPQPPQSSPCEFCGGSGLRLDSQTENITMLCEIMTKQYKQAAPTIQRVDGTLRCKTFMYNLPKILRCTEMVFETAIEGYMHMKFKLAGQPVDESNIIQGQFCVSLWEPQD